MQKISLKYTITILVFLICAGRLTAQRLVTGNVLNSQKEALPGVSIHLKGSPTGVNADSTGHFVLDIPGTGKSTLPPTGKMTLQVSAVGYESKEVRFDLEDSSLHLDIILQNKSKTLGDAVVISAGSFEASDKAKGASLTPMDAVTVAGSGGDIANALRSLPGAQPIADREGIFVRGGSSEEAKQFVDGALLPDPNFASVPGLPQPSRLNPFLFKGILFSTGGYSALYGDALSSALILETVDLPDKSSASLHFFPQNVGGGFQDLSRDGKSSYGFTAGYGNLHPYNSLVPQKPDFFNGPAYLSGDANYRVKTSKTGMLKFYTNYGQSNIGMRNPDFDSTNLLSSFNLTNTNVYSNVSYRESLGNSWKIDAVAAYNYLGVAVANQLLDWKHQPVSLTTWPYNQKNFTTNVRSVFGQGRFVLRKQYSHNQALRFGAEYFKTNDDIRVRYPKADTLDPGAGTLTRLKDNLVAGFAEGDIFLFPAMALKGGLRAEYSSQMKQFSLAPRISLAYRFHGGGQVNMAYGVFYQKPEDIYFAQKPDLHFTQASHYILNYQKKGGNRLFRVEAYYKVYKNLVTTRPSVGNRGNGYVIGNGGNGYAIGNGGNGYARGIELFWRDKKTIKDLDYWITYTYLDTKRKYLDFPDQMRPNFSTPHSFSLAVKKFFPSLNLSANMSYALATGRPYYDIRSDSAGKAFLGDHGATNTYNAMNLSFAYLFCMFPHWKNKDFSGIGFGVNNIFGTREVFGYNYSRNGDNRMPVTPPAVRSFYIGLFMSFGINRSDDFINQHL
jgi:vitamin B12 transporter